MAVFTYPEFTRNYSERLIKYPKLGIYGNNTGVSPIFSSFEAIFMCSKYHRRRTFTENTIKNQIWLQQKFGTVAYGPYLVSCEFISEEFLNISKWKMFCKNANANTQRINLNFIVSQPDRFFVDFIETEENGLTVTNWVHKSREKKRKIQ